MLLLFVVAIRVFPNVGNPNIISAQNYVFRVPAKPLLTGRIILLSGAQSFGVGINGVPLILERMNGILVIEVVGGNTSLFLVLLL